MREYAIVTDSSCDLSEELVKELDLTVVPLSVHIGTEHYRNSPEEAPDSHVFYDRLRKGEVAQTSAPNVEDFKKYMRPILEAGKDVLYLGFSTGLSATYQNGALAAEELQEEFPEARLLSVDTLCASMGQGLLVALAVDEKRKGRTLEEVLDYVKKQIPHLCHWFTVGDLNTLRRGGRLSAGKAIFGNMLHIKPVLHVDDEGHLVPVDSVKGRKKSIEALLKKMEESVIEPEKQKVFISHGDCLADAEMLAAMIKERLHVPTVTIGDVGPVIGAHSGPGTLALFFLGSRR